MPTIELRETWPLIIFTLILPVSYAVFYREKKPPYPPGPQPKPIIGNALDISFKGQPWLKYSEMSKAINSNIIHLSVLNNHIIVLQKRKDAIALLEKRSAIYSDRPQIPIFESIGLKESTPAVTYGDEWQQQRKILQVSMKKDRMPSYHQAIEEKAALMLGQMLADPSDFFEHCKMLSAAVILAITYGYDVTPGEKHGHLVGMAEFVGKTAAELFMPGGTLINILPFLRHIPSWVPGASTQRLAAEVKKVWEQYRNEPYEFVQRNLASGTSKPCMLANLLQTEDDGSYDERSLKSALASTYAAGVETMDCSLVNSILAMALHPDKQKKAQEEIDQVVGAERLPALEDRPSLPYVEAVLREVLRWRPVVPINPAHTSIKDDTYEGYYIPNGSLIITNIWAISRDEETYQDPDSFIPERFFKTDGTLNDDTVNYVFGFGRRVCPGRLVAESQLWLVIAFMLSVFSIAIAKDENGAEIDIDPDACVGAFVNFPLPFQCSITPRSKQAETVIRTAENVALRNLKGS